MIQRDLQTTLRNRLRQFPAVAVLGPRQVGKTTLVKTLSSRAGFDREPLYLDLENPQDLAKLEDARAYLARQGHRLIILDEIQRAPELFQVLRGLIDERIEAGATTGQFLILGSASIDLLRQSSESLAGRIAYLELDGLTIHEVGEAQSETLWLRGGFPRSFLAPDDEASAIWREAFITTYLERDIPQLGPRIAASTLRRFWTMLSHNQGVMLNAAQMAAALAIDGKTVAKYIDLMVDLLLVRRLEPYHTNQGKRLVKSPKTYVRDSGLAHSLLRLDTLDDVLGHPIAGASWEGYCIEQLIAATPARSKFSFYRTATGVELDLILELPSNQVWAVEIKRSSAPKVERGTYQAIEDIKPDAAFIVHGGKDRYPKGNGIEAISLSEMVNKLREL